MNLSQGMYNTEKKFEIVCCKKMKIRKMFYYNLVV